MGNGQGRLSARRWVFVSSSVLLFLAVAVQAAESAFKPVPLSDLPDFKAELEERVTKSGLVHTNGYISTVNTEEFPTEGLDDRYKIKLRKDRTGFREDFKVYAKWQPDRAPLAVIVVGIFGQADDKLGQHWQRLLYEAGCHVVCADSMFRYDSTKRTGQGVPGNPKAEAEVLAKIVEAVMDYRGDNGKLEPVRSRVSSVRLLGTSYGGVVALHLARTEAAQKWPIDRCLVLSAPVNMHSTAKIVDHFVKEDRPKFELSLAKLMGGYTPDKDQPSAKEESLIRAGIAYSFQEGLGDVVKESEKRYMKGYRDQLKAEEAAAQNRSGQPPAKKLSEWENWSFDDFVDLMAAPYWKTTPEEIWKRGDLATTLADAPAFAQVVVAADDPLNKPEDLATLKTKYGEPRLIVLPHGGHLGYCGTNWLKALISKTFKP